MDWIARHRVMLVGTIGIAIFFSYTFVRIFTAQVVGNENADRGAEERPVTEPSAAEEPAPKRERPAHMRKDQREELKAINAVQEAVGARIERQCEAQWAGGQGEACDFAAVKEQAVQEIAGAAEIYREDQPQEMEQEAAAAACFQRDCEPTNDRSACASLEEQRACFGMPTASQGSEEDLGMEELEGLEDSEAWHENESTWYGEEERMRDEEESRWHGNDRTSGPGNDIPYYLPSEADMMQYGQQNYVAEPMHSGARPFDDVLPDMREMLTVMEIMLPKLEKAIAIFERAGIAVPEQSRATARKALESFERLKGPCGAGDIQACMELGNSMGGIEANMRPPMERAMQEAIFGGKIPPEAAMRAGMEIQTMMSEGMEGMMQKGHGPPPGMMPNTSY